MLSVKTLAGWQIAGITLAVICLADGWVPHALAQSANDEASLNEKRIAAAMAAVTMKPVLAMAQKGDPVAEARLGAMYFRSSPYSGQFQAFRWLSLAARAGRPDAQVLLARMYDGGMAVTRDRGQALDWYEKAAVQGDVAGEEQLCIAYVTGEGRPQDGAKGQELCRKASAQLSGTGFYGLGLSEEQGIGKPADPVRAVADYQTAAGLGNGNAMDALGRLAQSGTKPDYAAARNWFHKAIGQGSIAAVDHMAQLYEGGRGTDVDMMEAARLYTHAAMYEYPHAQAWVDSHGDSLAALPQPLSTSNLPHLFAKVTHLAPPAPGQVPGTLVTEDLWDYFQEMSDYYPYKAAENDILGESSVTCHISPKLKLVDCLPVMEAPQGYGFSAAMTRFLDQDITLIVDKDNYGDPLANRDIQILIQWQM